MSVWIASAAYQGLTDSREATVSVFDHGLTVGDGVFETLLVRDGKPIALTRHLRRLEKSCSVLGLVPPALPDIRVAVREVIASEPDAAVLGRLRVTVTAGHAPLGSDRGSGPPTWIVAIVPTEPWPDTTSAVVVPWRRNERSAVVGAKTTSYAENVVALQWARARGFSEGLFLNSVGNVCEGASTNVFVVCGDRILTPSLSSGCLAGITRGLVLEWTEAQEAELSEHDLMSADEVFLTSSTREIHPVTDLGGVRTWPAAGDVTARVREMFLTELGDEPDPA